MFRPCRVLGGSFPWEHWSERAGAHLALEAEMDRALGGLWQVGWLENPGL